MPTPCPQPRPLTRNVVAVTAAGVVGEGARTPAGAETASARARPVRARSSRRMVDLPPRLAEEALHPGLPYRTFNSASSQTYAFSAAPRGARRRGGGEPPSRALPEPRADRPRRDGRGLPRRGRRPGADRRRQAALR